MLLCQQSRAPQMIKTAQGYLVQCTHPSTLRMTSRCGRRLQKVAISSMRICRKVQTGVDARSLEIVTQTVS